MFCLDGEAPKNIHRLKEDTPLVILWLKEGNGILKMSGWWISSTNSRKQPNLRLKWNVSIKPARKYHILSWKDIFFTDSEGEDVQFNLWFEMN